MLERDDHQKAGKDLLYFPFSTPSKERKNSLELSVDQSRFAAIHFKNLNHNNAVAEATTTATLSPFILEISQFFLSFEHFFFTATEGVTAEYPARKALLSRPRDTAVGFLLNSFVTSGFCMCLCILACFLMRVRCFTAFITLT